MSEETDHGDRPIPLRRVEKIISEREGLREQLKARDLEIASLKERYKDVDKTIKHSAKLEADLAALRSASSLRDQHDALRDAGINDKNGRDYLLMQTPEGKSPADYLTELRAAESIENSVLASIVKTEAAGPSAPAAPRTPGASPGAGPRATSRTTKDWDNLLATGSAEELSAALPEIRAANPVLAGHVEAAIAVLTPAG